MAPRGRPKPGTSRMDAAVEAMKPIGFDKKVVTAKMRELLKTYNGHYGFIESDAYIVLLEALLEDKEKEKRQKDIERGDTSNTNETVEGVQMEESHAFMPTVGLVGIPPSPPLPPAPEAPPPPPPLPEPVLNAALQQPPPGFAHQFTRKRKPCYGWISDDYEKPQFIQLPSSEEDFTAKTKIKVELKPEEM